jgi:hypothetical protein
MTTSTVQGGLELRAGDRVELIVADGSLARAYFDGVPAARLLGRARLASDERDVSLGTTGPAASSWDTLMKRLLGDSVETRERIKRAVARHTRVAVDEGPLEASDAVVATLVFAVASTNDVDASLAEIFSPKAQSGASCDPIVAFACGTYDSRLVSPMGDPRVPLFEACVRLAARAVVGPIPWERLRDSATKLSGPELDFTLLRPARGSLFPPTGDDDPPSTPRRMAQLERAELDTLVRKDPRELATAIVRMQAGEPPPSRRGRDSAQLDSLIADLARLLAHPGTLLIAVPPFEPTIEDALPVDRVTSPSWQPHDWSSPDSAALLAEALEKGSTTVPRVRGVVLGGGEPALDAIGAEMLHVTLHPFASAAFADMLARSGRPRDVIRLVTYFAIAPDPSRAARALAACTAPELPRVLAAWLEAMLPANGEPAPSGDDPETSSAARLTACVASLAPYPRLYGAVRPLLSRVSDAPPASA